MKRYVNSRTKGRVLCIAANHPTRRRGADIRKQAELGDPSPLRVHPDEEIVAYIEPTRTAGGMRAL